MAEAGTRPASRSTTSPRTRPSLWAWPSSTWTHPEATPNTSCPWTPSTTGVVSARKPPTSFWTGPSTWRTWHACGSPCSNPTWGRSAPTKRRASRNKASDATRTCGWGSGSTKCSWTRSPPTSRGRHGSNRCSGEPSPGGHAPVWPPGGGGSVGEDVGGQTRGDGVRVQGEGGPDVGAQVGPGGEPVVAPGGGQGLHQQQPALAFGPVPFLGGAFRGDVGGGARAAGVADRQVQGVGVGQAQGAKDLAVLGAGVGVLDGVGEQFGHAQVQGVDQVGGKPRQVVGQVGAYPCQFGVGAGVGAVFPLDQGAAHTAAPLTLVPVPVRRCCWRCRIRDRWVSWSNLAGTRGAGMRGAGTWGAGVWGVEGGRAGVKSGSWSWVAGEV